MPFGIKPICSSCGITSSPIWRKGSHGEVLCNSCGLKHLSGTSLNLNAKDNASSGNSGQKNGANSITGNSGPVLRKSTRIKPAKKGVPPTKSTSSKGKGRRVIFKQKAPMRAPASIATVVTGESVFHKDQYYQVGDVVSLVDHGGGLFYAQLRGFLSDQYNEKSAIITWLLPTVNSPQDKFDPSTYILGPEEDLPRKMEYMEFVCHAPSDYFRARDAPYKTEGNDPKLCFIWTSIGPRVKVTPTIDEIFGVGAMPGSDSGGGRLRCKRERRSEGSSLDEGGDGECR